MGGGVLSVGRGEINIFYRPSRLCSRHLHCFLVLMSILCFVCLNDCKFYQVSRTVLSIMSVLRNVVLMVSTCSPVSNSSNFLTNLLGIVHKYINYNWYQRHLHVPYCFSSLSKSKRRSLFLISLIFTL